MSKWWGALNTRERRLALATVALVAIAGVVLGARNGYLRLRDLDSRIAQREAEFENLTRLYAQRETVEDAYRSVVKEHSTGLTKQEIHDNLRREIFRLTSIRFPGKDKKPGPMVQLVTIPSLREGELRSEGNGYREYRIQFRIPEAKIFSLMFFLELIEKSNQILRIDSLDIGRSPGEKLVHAHLRITRTVLDDPESDIEENPSDRSAARPQKLRTTRGESLPYGGIRHGRS